jgi:hypothetical protein
VSFGHLKPLKVSAPYYPSSSIIIIILILIILLLIYYHEETGGRVRGLGFQVAGGHLFNSPWVLFQLFLVRTPKV